MKKSHIILHVISASINLYTLCLCVMLWIISIMKRSTLGIIMAPILTAITLFMSIMLIARIRSEVLSVRNKVKTVNLTRFVDCGNNIVLYNSKTNHKDNLEWRELSAIEKFLDDNYSLYYAVMLPMYGDLIYDEVSKKYVCFNLRISK